MLSRISPLPLLREALDDSTLQQPFSLRSTSPLYLAAAAADPSMSSARASAKRRAKDPEPLRVEKKRQNIDDLDPEGDISSDIKGILSALQYIKEKAQKDGLKKNEETIESVASEFRRMINDLKVKTEKERQSFLKTLSKSSKECESSLKNEYAKFQSAHDNFCKEKAAHLQTIKEIFSKYQDEKEKMLARYEQQRKKEKIALSELEKTCADKMVAAEESLKKKKLDDKSFSILRKSLGSFLDPASDEDFGPDE